MHLTIIMLFTKKKISKSIESYWWFFLAGGLSINSIFIWKFAWQVKSIICQENLNSGNCCKSQIMCGNAGPWMWCPDFGYVSTFLESCKVGLPDFDKFTVIMTSKFKNLVPYFVLLKTWFDFSDLLLRSLWTILMFYFFPAQYFLNIY